MSDIYLTSFWQVLYGLVTLFSGRQLFWLVVGILGFFTGVEVSQGIFYFKDPLTVLIIAFLSGGAGIVLTMLFQRFAVIVAGFVVGGYLSMNLWYGPSTFFIVPISWPFVVGGILGALTAGLLLDWALIILSSAFGAMLIIFPIVGNTFLSVTLFALFFIMGIVVQVSFWKK